MYSAGKTGSRSAILIALRRSMWTERRPLASSSLPTAVVIIEDLHWIDAASEEFIEALADAVVGTTTLLVVNFRPGFTAPLMQRSRARCGERAKPPLPPASLETGYARSKANTRTLTRAQRAPPERPARGPTGQGRKPVQPNASAPIDGPTRGSPETGSASGSSG
jgi:hypothetical protein